MTDFTTYAVTPVTFTGATDTVNLIAHGFVSGAMVKFATLSVNTIVTETLYYVIYVDVNAFKLSTTCSTVFTINGVTATATATPGTAININDGTGSIYRLSSAINAQKASSSQRDGKVIGTRFTYAGVRTLPTITYAKTIRIIGTRFTYGGVRTITPITVRRVINAQVWKQGSGVRLSRPILCTYRLLMFTLHPVSGSGIRTGLQISSSNRFFTNIFKRGSGIAKTNIVTYKFLPIIWGYSGIKSMLPTATDIIAASTLWKRTSGVRSMLQISSSNRFFTNIFKRGSGIAKTNIVTYKFLPIIWGYSGIKSMLPAATDIIAALTLWKRTSSVRSMLPMNTDIIAALTLRKRTSGVRSMLPTATDVIAALTLWKRTSGVRSMLPMNTDIIAALTLWKRASGIVTHAVVTMYTVPRVLSSTRFTYAGVRNVIANTFGFEPKTIGTRFTYAGVRTMIANTFVFEPKTIGTRFTYAGVQTMIASTYSYLPEVLKYGGVKTMIMNTYSYLPIVLKFTGLNTIAPTIFVNIFIKRTTQFFSSVQTISAGTYKYLPIVLKFTSLNAISSIIFENTFIKKTTNLFSSVNTNTPVTFENNFITKTTNLFSSLRASTASTAETNFVVGIVRLFSGLNTPIISQGRILIWKDILPPAIKKEIAKVIQFWS